MIEFQLLDGGHVYISPEHAESVRPGHGSGATLSSIVTLASGAQYDVLGSTYEIVAKLAK